MTEHPRRVKSRMGVVPQEDNLDEEITVLDNLLIHARYYGLKSKNRALDGPRAARVHGADREKGP